MRVEWCNLSRDWGESGRVCVNHRATQSGVQVLIESFAFWRAWFNMNKIVYLVRHAESIENEKLASVKYCLGQFGSFGLPEWKKFKHGASLLGEPSIVDSKLSKDGEEQVESLTKALEESEFLKEKSIELIVHSPLTRARDTCRGVVNSCSEDHEFTLLELECIREKYISEWLPGYGSSSLNQRIDQFGEFVNKESRTMIVVGHSQFFKKMLGMDEKFNNCDVWQVEYSYDEKSGQHVWENPVQLVDIHQDDQTEQQINVT
mmetsp:Transcript_613/g.788  ORF Transcript_613/g.788 Transcript_613/m.788 type:complete len:261 (-) Transcript_613:2088-2870(-)